jgi:ATP-binding cassette, subfamily C (CFTR/MRP), member 1
LVFAAELDGKLLHRTRVNLLITNSGKSTLLSVLLRVIDPSSGEVTIGGIDISALPRDIVRQKLICLPQDPLILPGAFMFNLDPDQRSNFAEIESILKQFRLWDLITK